ncbi:hypothetical protein AAMO2058_000211200 [Amorphochlora amoebiformis]
MSHDLMEVPNEDISIGWRISRAIQLALAASQTLSCIWQLTPKQSWGMYDVLGLKFSNLIISSVLVGWCVDANGIFGIYAWRDRITFINVLKATFQTLGIIACYRIAKATLLAQQKNTTVVSSDQVSIPLWMMVYTLFLIITTWICHIVSLILVRDRNKQIWLLFDLTSTLIVAVTLFLALLYFGGRMWQYIKNSRHELTVFDTGDATVIASEVVKFDQKKKMLLESLNKAERKLLILVVTVTSLSVAVICMQIYNVVIILQNPNMSYTNAVVVTNPNNYDAEKELWPYFFIFLATYFISYVWESGGSIYHFKELLFFRCFFSTRIQVSSQRRNKVERKKSGGQSDAIVPSLIQNLSSGHSKNLQQISRRTIGTTRVYGSEPLNPSRGTSDQPSSSRQRRSIVSQAPSIKTHISYASADVNGNNMRKVIEGSDNISIKVNPESTREYDSGKRTPEMKNIPMLHLTGIVPKESIRRQITQNPARVPDNMQDTIELPTLQLAGIVPKDSIRMDVCKKTAKNPTEDLKVSKEKKKMAVPRLYLTGIVPENSIRQDITLNLEP